jgi:opacity protein-like surface antigen
MEKPLIGMAVLLMVAGAVHAQQGSVAAVVAQDSEASAAIVSGEAVALGNGAGASGDVSGARSMTLATPSEASAESHAAPAEPAAPAAAKPKFVFGSRDDYRWQLGLGVEFFRFQSSILNASMVGLNTTLTYYTNSWFGLEGNLVTGFAPEIYDREHVKYFGGGGGIRIGTRKAQFEPWGHVLVGGGHLQPQTQGNSRGALTVQAGVGVDYRIHSRLSLRAEGDYVYSDFFKETQNNFQAVAAVVFHF